MELGVTELYFAVQNCVTNCPIHPASYYLQEAPIWANAYMTGPNDAGDTLNLYDVSGLAHFELYRAMALAGNPSGLATTSRIAGRFAETAQQTCDTEWLGSVWIRLQMERVGHNFARRRPCSDGSGI